MRFNLPAAWRAARPWLLLGPAVLLLWIAMEFVLRAGLSLWLLPHLPPAWWIPGAAKVVRIFTWLHINSGIGLAIACLPVATGLVVFAPRRGLWIAVLVTALMIATHPMLYEYVPIWSTLKRLGQLSIVADLVKQALTLPLLTLICGWVMARRRLGGTGTPGTPLPIARRPEGVAVVGLTTLLAAAALPLFYMPVTTGEGPAGVTLWALLPASPAAALVLGAPLAAGLALAVGARGRFRRIVLAAVPVLIVYGLAALALEATRAMILERIKAPVPAQALWNPDLLFTGSWALLAAALLLLLAWGMALRPGGSGPMTDSG